MILAGQRLQQNQFSAASSPAKARARARARARQISGCCRCAYLARWSSAAQAHPSSGCAQTRPSRANTLESWNRMDFRLSARAPQFNLGPNSFGVRQRGKSGLNIRVSSVPVWRGRPANPLVCIRVAVLVGALEEAGANCSGKSWGFARALARA